MLANIEWLFQDILIGVLVKDIPFFVCQAAQEIPHMDEIPLVFPSPLSCDVFDLKITVWRSPGRWRWIKIHTEHGRFSIFQIRHHFGRVPVSYELSGNLSAQSNAHVPDPVPKQMGKESASVSKLKVLFQLSCRLKIPPDMVLVRECHSTRQFGLPMSKMYLGSLTGDRNSRLSLGVSNSKYMK